MPVRTSRIPDRDTALSSWWESPLGRALLAAESELLSEALEDVFGWELLQVGAWGNARELLAGSRTRRQSLIAAAAPPAGADIIGRPSLLPVISDCADAALLPHTLEFAADPYAVLREVDRVLAGEGQLLVLGFRPWSLWGMRARWSRSGFPPGMRRAAVGAAAARVAGAARLRGGRRAALPVRESLEPGPGDAARAPRRMLRAGLYPLPAGAYLLKARKRVYTLTPCGRACARKPR